METPMLMRHLRSVGRRLLAVRVASGVGWALTATLLLLILGGWFDLLWELPPGLRIATSIVALVASLFVVTLACGLAWRRRAPRLLAQRLDTVAATGGEILAGVDLLLDRNASSPLTSGLTTIAVERAGRLAGQIAGRQAIPARPVGWSLASLSLVGAGLALVAVCLPRLAQTQWLRFTDPFGDHPPYSRVIYHVEPGDVQVVFGTGLDIRVTTEGAPVDRMHLVLQTQDPPGEEAVPMFPEPGGEWRATVANVTTPGRYFVRSHAGRSARFRLGVLTVPRLEAIRFRITPPAYTNLPAYEGRLPQGGLAGLPGTKVQVWAKSNRPLAGGALQLPGSQSLILMPVAPQSPEATATFEVRKPGKLQLRLTDTDGQHSTETFTTSIALLTDERPSIRLVEPPPVSLATPDVTLPVAIAAEDDYGITRIELFRSLNDSRPLSVSVPVKAPPPTRLLTTVLLPLASYGLEPGDEIKLFARVEDNDPAGPKGAESPIAVVRIISQADFERLVRARRGMEMLQSKYRQAQRRLEALSEEADRLKKKVKDNPTSEAAKQAREDLQKLAEKMQMQAEALRRSAQKPLGYDLDKHLSEHLQRLSRKLDEAAKQAEKLSRDQNLTPEQLADALDKLRNQLQREQDELQREAIEPLEHLASIQPLLEDASRFVIIYQRQRALAERLKSIKDKERIDDPKQKGRLRDLQTEQEEIRQDLARLLDDLEDHATKLPDDPQLEEFRNSIREFVEQVRGSGATEAMTEAEGGLASLSGKRGHAGAEKAADILEKFLDKCQGKQGLMGQGLAGLKFKPCLQDGLGDTVAQLLGDAGLLPGMGEGGGNGYSARRNSMDNVGLYGGMPGMEDLAPSGPASGDRSGAVGSLRTGTGERGGPAGAVAPGAPSGSTGSEAAVPVLYRRRVAEYFQRIADETGGK